MPDPAVPDPAVPDPAVPEAGYLEPDPGAVEKGKPGVVVGAADGTDSGDCTKGGTCESVAKVEP
ncbi:MAG: hypothetical protein AAGG48_29175 [Planctomycetota bacterium]